VEEENIDIVKSLLERGVDVDGRIAGNRPLLHRAAETGNVDVVRLLIEYGAEVDSRDHLDSTPLHISSQWGASQGGGGTKIKYYRSNFFFCERETHPPTFLI